MNVVKRNRIVFKRINDLNVLGYILKAKQLIDGQEIINTISTIENIYSPNPVKKSINAEYNSNFIFYINDEVFYNDQYEVSVYVNNQKVLDTFVLYNSHENYVELLYKDFDEFDIIKIEYFYDGIEYIHNTNIYSEYFVDLVIDSTSNTVGDHNILL